MAQIGFYVACTKFTYFPYKKIFTRINGDDNIFKGMSSFAVEMDELRSILKYSDHHSIVLGDEICKGTEETSALSIVSASIMRFCNNNVNFIMATHFHKLYELEVINNINNIKFMHLSISYDEDNGSIIYGRKLQDGPGSTLYGIEVAKYIIEDELFIDNAQNINNVTVPAGTLEICISLLNIARLLMDNKKFKDASTLLDNIILDKLDVYSLEEQNKIYNIIIDITSGNRFYSDIYAKLLSKISEKYKILIEILIERIELYLNNYEFVEKNKESYDEMCKINKENDKSEAFSLFLVNLEKYNVIKKEIVIDIIDKPVILVLK
jgi:hypothetical protein